LEVIKIIKSVVINEKLNIRYETLDGVKYLVVPVVMVREQVLNGELLPAEEIEKSAPGWNDRSVVVHHPQKENGDSVSAGLVEIIEDYHVGRIHNVVYDTETTKLSGEAWLDIKKMDKNEETRSALEHILKSKRLDVSTGYYVNNPQAFSGIHEGKAYNIVQRDILPDHLALLPGDVGACSWEDGAGVRNNKKIARALDTLKNALLPKANTQVNLREELMKALVDDDANVNWIVETLYDRRKKTDFVIYEKQIFDEQGNHVYPANGNLFRRDYKLDTSGSIVLGDKETKVRKKSTYITDNARQTQIMLSEALLSQIQSSHPDVKTVAELYHDKADGTDYAVFAKKIDGKEFYYKVSYNFDRESGDVTLGDTATQVTQARQYIDSDTKPKQPQKRSDKMSKFSKTKKGKGRTNKKPPVKLNMGRKTRVNYEDEVGYDQLYSALDEYDPDGIYEYVQAYEYLQLDEPEVEAKIDYVVAEATTEEEAAQELDNVLDDVYSYIQYLEHVADSCVEKILELGYEPASEYYHLEYNPDDQPAENMDTSDLTNPDYTIDDEEKTVKELETARRKGSRRNNTKQKTLTAEQYIKNVPDKDLREFMVNGEKQHASYRNGMIKNIMVANRQWKQNELSAMPTAQLEKLCSSLRIELPDYGLRGMQTNSEQDKGYTPMTKNIFAKKEGGK